MATGPIEKTPSPGPLWAYPAAFALLMVLGHAFGKFVDVDREVHPRSLDHRVHSWVVRHRADWPNLTLAFDRITRLGNAEVATSAVLAVAAALWLMRRRGVPGVERGEALFWLAVTGSGHLMNVLLKLWFRRERPPVHHRLVAEWSYSFPSGHSLFAAVFFALSTILLSRVLSRLAAWSVPPLILLGLFTAILVATSRVWLGVHYFSDVAGGFLLGLLWAATACAIRFQWPRHAALQAP